MSTIFPGSASVNQEFNGYRFNGTTWDIIGQEYNPTVYSGTQPENGKAGDIWIDSSIDVPAISPETILTINSASTIYLDKVSASTTYATKTELENIDLSPYLTSSNASSTYITKVSASTTYATKAELANIDLSSASAAAVAAIVDSAPATLDTLNELAAALGDDANYASTITTALGTKAPSASPTFTGTVVIPTLDLTNPLSPQDGGTGLNSLGSAGYVLKVNSGANALEWGSIAGAVYQENAPVSPQVGDVWVDSNASASVINTNDFLLKADVPTTPVYKMNIGTTSERPTGAAGLFRFNSTTGYPEWYDTETSLWWNFYEEKNLLIEYLVIAGGGGGGGTLGGGGGAGGYLTNTQTFLKNTSYTLTVGAGGAAGAVDNPGVNGSNSIFSSIISIGGGYGPRGNTSTALSGGTGGSGGGSGGASSTATAGGAGTSGQGFAGGGFDASVGTYTPGNGGGGAGAVGGGAINAANISSARGGTGGSGLSSSITGSAVTRSGGGGGGGWAVAGTAGTGGGGAGGVATGSINGVAGTANTGGGGGGAAQQNSGAYTGGVGGAGGSGIVILSYPSSRTITIGAGLTASTSFVNANKVTIFTAGTGTVSFV
jgi:hypothetical protein